MIVCLLLLVVVMPPSKKRWHLALHMSVGLSVCRSVTFCFRPITSEPLDLPSSILVHTSVMYSRGNLLILGSLGKRSRSPGSNVPEPLLMSNSRTPLPTLYKRGPHIHHILWRNHIDFWVIISKVKVIRVKCGKTV